MYFHKLEEQPPTWARSLSYIATQPKKFYLFTECSRGTATIRKVQCPAPQYDHWSWRVEMVDRRTRRTTSTAMGEEKTLYAAAQAVLQRLFSQRRTGVSFLLNLLVKDQVMFELSRLGEEKR